MDALLRILQINRPELPRVLWMCAASACLGCTVATVRVGVNDAFLGQYEATDLPYAYGLSGTLGLLVLWAFKRFGDRVRFSRRMQILVFCCAAQTALAGLAVAAAEQWEGWVFVAYAWFSPLVTLTGLAFWSMTREMFSLREQRRLVAVLSGGEVIAAISCYMAIAVLSESESVRPYHFMMLGALALTSLGFVLRGASRRFPLAADELRVASRGQAPESGSGSNSEPETPIYKERYYLQMAGISLLSIVCLFVLDFAFKDQLKQIESNGGLKLSAMIAMVFGLSKGIELFAKVFLSARVLRLMGLRDVLASLPIMLVLVAFSTFFLGYHHPPDASGFTRLAYLLVFAKLMWEVLRRAFFGPQFNLLYQAVSAERRQAYQTGIDGAFRQMAVILAAIVLLPLRETGSDGPSVFIVLAVLAGTWAVLTHFACRTYAQNLISGLKSSARRFRDALRAGRAGEGDLSDLMSDPSPARTQFSPTAPRWVREIVLQRARDAGDLDLRGPLAKLAEGRDVALVRTLAGKLKAEYDDIEALAQDTEGVVKMIESSSAYDRMLGAHALRFEGSASRSKLEVAAHAKPTAHDEILGNLLWDSDVSVMRAAIHTAGSFNADRFGQRICNTLPDEHLADVAVQALTRLGPAVDVALDRAFSRPGQSEDLQLRILLIYGAREDPEAAQWIRRQVLHPRPRVRQSALALLARMEVSLAGSEEAAVLHADIEHLAANVGWLVAALSGLRKVESASAKLLREALLTDLLGKRAEIFARLAVLYPSDAISSARLNLDMGEKVNVDHALEVLRTLVAPQLHEYILPLAQGVEDMRSMAKLRGLVIERAKTPDAWAREVVVSDGRRVGLWAKACALQFLRGRAGDESKAMLHHPKALLREQAARALHDSDPARYEGCVARLGREREAVDALLFEDPEEGALKPEEETYFGLVRRLERSVLGRLLSCEGRMRLVGSAERVSLPPNSLLGLEGEPDTDVYIVLRGVLQNRARNGSEDDTEYTIGPGELATFGLGTRILATDGPVDVLKTCGYRICELLWFERLLGYGV